jgi:hypothetical protein
MVSEHIEKSWETWTHRANCDAEANLVVLSRSPDLAPSLWHTAQILDRLALNVVVGAAIDASDGQQACEK